jgi:hypothetical protein
MRYLLGFAICFVLSGLVNAEVVLSNNTSTTTNNINLNNASFTINFTPTSVLTFEKFFLNIDNNFGGTALTQVKLSINGGADLTWNGSIAAGLDNQLIDFDISSLGQSTLSPTSLVFQITGMTGGNTSQTAINTANTQTVTGSWNNSYSNGSGVLFEITAVPEPGTLLLGGIAAACGGTGVWWKRRKRQPQPETTEQPAAI